MGEFPFAKLIQLLPLVLAGTGAIKDPGMATIAGLIGGGLPQLFPGMMGGGQAKKEQQPYFGGLGYGAPPGAQFGLTPQMLELLRMRFPQG